MIIIQNVPYVHKINIIIQTLETRLTSIHAKKKKKNASQIQALTHSIFLKPDKFDVMP